MNPLAGEIVSILFQIIRSSIEYGPAIINDLELVYGLVTSGTTLTPEQQAQADQALAAAHQALQASVAADALEDQA